MLLTSVGSALYDRFLQASFYIPAYLLFSGVYILFAGYSRKVILIQMSTIVPFLTAAWFCRIMDSGDPLRVIYGILIFILFAVEIYGILVLFFKEKFLIRFGREEDIPEEAEEETEDEAWENRLRDRDIFSDTGETAADETGEEPESDA